MFVFLSQRTRNMAKLVPITWKRFTRKKRFSQLAIRHETFDKERERDGDTHEGSRQAVEINLSASEGCHFSSSSQRRLCVHYLLSITINVGLTKELEEQRLEAAREI